MQLTATTRLAPKEPCQDEIMKRTIAILGWGSLLWDTDHPDFERQHDEWHLDGPTLSLEFSRVSVSRHLALTLVLNYQGGRECTVAYALSRRSSVLDAIADLRCREGTTMRNVGVFSADGSAPSAREPRALESVKAWAARRKIDHVVWTDLGSNFQEKSLVKKPFAVSSAMEHLQLLDSKGKAAAAEYVWRAPDFVRTPVRDALESSPWFKPGVTAAS
jgi:hypothetical protein